MLSKMSKYFKGELSEKEALEMQVWLAAHSDDKEVLNEMDRIFGSMSDEHFSSAGEDSAAARRYMSMSEAALSKVKARLGIASRGRAFVKGLRWTERVAAILAIPLLVALAFLYIGKPVSEEIAWMEVNVPAGQIDTVYLADGSTLVLNSGSRITYPSGFSGTERRIFVEGEVLADIAKDPEKPFIIQSGDVNVRVHGTKFDFKAYGENSCVELLLMEGSVSLDVNRGDVPREIRMGVGDMVHYDRTTGDIDLTSFNPDGFKTFAGGSLHFINPKMNDIAKDLERVFNVHISILDKSLADTRFLAFFSNNETLDQILASMNTDNRMNVVKRDGVIYLDSSL